VKTAKSETGRPSTTGLLSKFSARELLTSVYGMGMPNQRCMIGYNALRWAGPIFQHSPGPGNGPYHVHQLGDRGIVEPKTFR
jgi:hypothetical protein